MVAVNSLVSSAAVIRVVAQRFFPLMAVSGEKCFAITLITAAKDTMDSLARFELSSQKIFKIMYHSPPIGAVDP